MTSGVSDTYAYPGTTNRLQTVTRRAGGALSARRAQTIRSFGYEANGNVSTDNRAVVVGIRLPIRLDPSVFTALPAGLLADDALQIATPVCSFWGTFPPQPTADTRLIYDPTNGHRSYDADGAGAASAPLLIAKLAPGLALTADDFVVA